MIVTATGASVPDNNDEVAQLRTQLAVELRRRPVKDRTQVDVINERLRKALFDRLEAQIKKLPADQHELFRTIQSLLGENSG